MAEARILGRYPLCDANSSDTECEATGAKSRSCSVADPSRVFASKWLLLRGFPRALEGEMAWQPDKYKDSRDYTYTLSDAEIVELEDAVGAFKELGLDGDLIKRDNFPLPVLGHRLHAFAQDLHEGKGFFILRGLDPERYSSEDNMLLYLGISSYVGDRRGRQNPFTRDMLTHIVDQRMLSLPFAHLNTKDGMKDFHNDIICDILALQTRHCASQGGSNMLASAWTVYNDLISSRPDVVMTLCKPNWPYWSPEREPPYHLRPLLFYVDGNLILSADSGHLGPQAGYPASQMVPELSKVQREALNVVLAAATKKQIRISPRPGDLMFINNFSMLHARESFVEEGGEGRHLVRLWLRNDDLGWRLPLPLRSSWDVVFSKNDGLQDLYPIEPQFFNTPPTFFLYSGSH